MAITFQQFDGQVTNAQADIVSAVTNTTLIFSQAFHNTDASAIVLDIWLHDGTTARKLHSVSVDPDTTFIDDTKYTLTSGQKIQAQAGTTLVIDFWISGAEIT